MAFGVGKVILAVALAVTSPVLTAGAAVAAAGGAIVASKVLNSKEYDVSADINFSTPGGGSAPIRINFSKAALADPLGQGDLPVDDKNITWTRGNYKNDTDDKGNLYQEQEYTSGSMKRTLRLTQTKSGRFIASIEDVWPDSTGAEAKRVLKTDKPINLSPGVVNIGVTNTKGQQWSPGNTANAKPNTLWSYPGGNAAKPAAVYSGFVNPNHRSKKSGSTAYNISFQTTENLKWAGYEVGSGLTGIVSNVASYAKNVSMNPYVIVLGLATGFLPALAVVAFGSYLMEQGMAKVSNNWQTRASQISNNLARTP